MDKIFFFFLIFLLSCTFSIKEPKSDSYWQPEQKGIDGQSSDEGVFRDDFLGKDCELEIFSFDNNGKKDEKETPFVPESADFVKDMEPVDFVEIIEEVGEEFLINDQHDDVWELIDLDSDLFKDIKIEKDVFSDFVFDGEGIDSEELVDFNVDIFETQDVFDSNVVDEFDLVQGDDLASDVEADNETVVDCPAGYAWNGDYCESFCPADQYFELSMMQCLKFPCCDISGKWELKIMNTETLQFTFYQLDLSQNIAVVNGLLINLNIVEDDLLCFGILSDKNFELSCDNGDYSLSIENTAMNAIQVAGFYELQKGETLIDGSYFLKKE
ncbi:MAG: hypothetical protein WCT18_01545 [Patescibacteria group bacterium]